MHTVEEQAKLKDANDLLRRDFRDLTSENRYLKRKFFGSPASERISDEHLTLALAELEEEAAEQIAARM